MKTRDPSGEYQTRSTGPVAKPAKSRSITVVPMCRQSADTAAGACAQTGWVEHRAAAKAAAIPHRTVAILPIDESIVPFTIGGTGQKILIPRAVPKEIFKVPWLLCNFGVRLIGSRGAPVMERVL
jgi:hypothetical protein